MRHIKLTGGDPALYTHLVSAVREIKATTAVETVEIISRHPRIGFLAPDLATAGADLFNISIDTLDPILHKRICGINDLAELTAAVGAVVRTGIPVKINTVVMAGINEHEIPSLITFCERVGVHSLKLLDVIDDLDGGVEFNSRRLRRQTNAEHLAQLYMPLANVTASLRTKALSIRVERQGDLGHPMSVLEMPSGLKVIVKDSQAGAWYGNVCQGCKFYPCHDALMALRLTADLRGQVCLLREDVVVDLADVIKARNSATLRNVLTGICRTYDTAEFLSNVVPNNAEEVA